MEEKLYTNITIEKLPHSEIAISGEIPVSIADTHRAKALKRLQADFEIPGFRKGRVPEHIVVERLGEVAILQETAEVVLSRAYADLVIEHNLEVIGRPMISLTKLAPGNPIGFKIQTAVMPEVELPDYKTIAGEKRKETDDPSRVEVTDEDYTPVFLDVRRNWAHMQYHKDHPEDEGHGHGELKDEELPPLTDEMVQALGNFTDIADFKTKIHDNIKRDKELKTQEKRRLAISDAILEKTTVDVPELFIESELDKMMSEFSSTISRMGLTVEGYLQHISKTEEDLRRDWRTEAQKRAKLQLTLSQIALKESITPDETQVERETAHLLEHYNDVNPDNVRAYVSSMLRNEKVFQFLETGTKEEEKAAEPEK